MIDFSVTFLEYEFKKTFTLSNTSLVEISVNTPVPLTLMMKGGFELSVKGSDQTLEHL